MTSKTRLVSKQKRKHGEPKYTIPRLELMGNLLLSKLVISGTGAIKEAMVIDKLYCWSDSMISLAWIKARSKEFRTFVQNRVVTIRRNVNEAHWRHCKSEDNAADILTKDKR